MIIDVTNPGTFPAEIKPIVFNYLSTLPQNVKDRIVKEEIVYPGDVRIAIEDYMAPFKADSLYNGVIGALKGNSLISYHATKVLDEQDILKNGLLTNEWNRYSSMLKQVFDMTGVNESDTITALGLVEHEYKRKYIERTPQLCFFSSIGLLESDEGHAAFDQFCENIGGELARWALKSKMPEVYQKLKSNGKACVIKVALPYEDLMDFLYDRVAYQFISYYAGKYFWDYEYEIEYDCITEKDVTPDKILEVIPYTKEVDYP